MTEITHELDASSSLSDASAPYLSATRAAKTAQIYLAAPDALIRHREAFEFRALPQFWGRFTGVL